ncbi:ATP-binding cassette domain-containing protein [Nonomuraea sp. NPDC050783]|uniref:ABC transporter ATP-binding protein n=1 Tax=Nonomuraea sp. NPDC050783 TaxID=3154634 RepID=UPI003465F31C
MTAAIRVSGLRKSHQGFEAVRGISFEVAEGEVFALLGRNGAGKTTTVEVLAGFQRADGGEVRVLGLDPHADRGALRRRSGIMVQEAGFFPDLTVAATVDTWRGFSTAPRPRAEVLELAGLGARAGVRVRQLSGGEKRRLDLALALLGRPEVLFLDEPTAGMDPEARAATWDVVRGLAGEGTTVLLTTHYLEEAQRLAGGVAILDEGRLVASGGMAETLAGRAGRVAFLMPAGVGPGELPLPVAVEDGRAVCRADDPDLAAQTLLTWAAGRGLRLAGLEVRPPTLEDLFLDLGDRSGGGPGGGSGGGSGERSGGGSGGGSGSRSGGAAVPAGRSAR